MVTGSWLCCLGIHANKTANGLYATCRSGAFGYSDPALEAWNLYMPQRLARRETAPADQDDNLEDLLELVLTTAWRRGGWIPLHAGAVVRDARCAIIAAPSRGGKTTATLALLHRGWKTLGDDKLLVKQSSEGRADLYAVQSLFNIDPQANAWFPEIGDLSNLPLDSAWTPKRRVSIESLWQDRMLARAEPTHLVQIQRFTEPHPTRFVELGGAEVLTTLLRQLVIPGEREIAAQILRVVTALARQVRGLRLELGAGAYADPRTLDLMERMLE